MKYIEEDKHIPRPDYNLMWTAIEKEAYKRQVHLQPSLKTARFGVRAIPASIIFSCLLLVAIPVFAGVTINWDKVGGRSVTNALNNGIGQQYDLQASSSGVTMKLNGVVTDGEQMKMLISLDPKTDLTSYIGFATEKNTMTDASGAKAKVYGYLEHDPESQKIIGIYETPDTLKDDKKDYKFEAQDLIFYSNRDIPLKSSGQAGDTIVTGVAQYPTLHIESVQQASEQTIIRYRVAASPSDKGQGNPHLVVRIDGQERNAVPTLMPSEGSDLLIEQVFDMNGAEWKEANLHLSYIEEAKRISGTWTFDFRADGKKANEVIYTKKLHTSPEFQENTGITLEWLAVTPLNIQVLIDEQSSYKQGIVNYKTAQLVIGDKTITGDRTLKGDPENYQHLFQFESPEWYKSWSDVPMKLILKDAIIEKRDTSKNWITLTKPKQEKQFAKLNVDGFEIQFTYYTENGKLMVESTSKSPGFKGVNQTTLRINGKEVVPEITPKGMVSTGINLDSYKDIPFDETIELNPGIYKYSDPSFNAEIKL